MIKSSAIKRRCKIAMFGKEANMSPVYAYNES